MTKAHFSPSPISLCLRSQLFLSCWVLSHCLRHYWTRWFSGILPVASALSNRVRNYWQWQGFEDSDDQIWSDLPFSLLQLFNKVDVGETLSVDTISTYLKRKFPKANAERILGVESEYDDKRKVRKWSSLYFLFYVHWKQLFLIYLQ